MNQTQTMPRTETMQLNVGPSHPSTHGVLRVLVELDGELILKADPDIGFLHRGIEKMCEYRTYHKCMPLMNRLDYLAGEVNNFGFCLAVEKLLGVEIPKRAQYIRVLLAELTRIASHLFWLGTHGHDLGAMTPLFYCFREREQIMDMCEMVSGARMFPLYFRIGGLAADLPEGFLPVAKKFAETFVKTGRTTTLCSPRTASGNSAPSASAPCPRTRSWIGAGPAPWPGAPAVDWDLRRDNPYSSYEEFDFVVPLGTHRRHLRPVPGAHAGNAPERPHRQPGGGEDPADRARHHQMRRSQGDTAAQGAGLQRNRRPDPPLPAHPGRHPAAGGGSLPVHRGPQGRNGASISSDGSPKPFRLKVRGAVLSSCSAPCDKLSRGRLLSDMIALIGTMDIVLADVDRWMSRSRIRSDFQLSC